MTKQMLDSLPLNVGLVEVEYMKIPVFGACRSSTPSDTDALSLAEFSRRYESMQLIY